MAECKNVVFLIFNRPDVTKLVFDQIAKAKPQRLFIVADGPRAERPEEKFLCEQTREVVDNIDWNCEVLRNYSDSNMGTRDRVSSGLDWVFGKSEDAIILEDDCLPDPTFFRYASELLERYREDNRIVSISGNNFQPNPPPDGSSYYFSRYPHIWGWATWKRVWCNYDVKITQWGKEYDKEWLSKVLNNQKATDYWSSNFDSVRNGWPKSWCFQWLFYAWRSKGLSTLPARNLVKNIGFDSNATNTKDKNNWLASLEVWPMNFPLQHPEQISQNIEFDDWTERNVYGNI